MNKIIIAVFMLCVLHAHAQQKTLQERLGYPKNAKLLIIHADDIGVTQTENEATIYAMEKGSVNSGSIMVPCPWFPEIAAYAVAHPKADLGLHLVLTSEWKYYKWGPVLHEQVPSLLTEQGFLTDGSVNLSKKATLADVEKELRAQIDRAIAFGIDPSHLDSHMGMLFNDIEFLKIYLKLGREYKMPAMISNDLQKLFTNIDIAQIVTDKDVVIDKIFTATPQDFAGGMKPYYTKVLTSLEPGVSIILLHAAYNNSEMKAVTVDHPDWGAAWRQADVDFFTSAECKKMLQDQHITLVTWREIRDKLLR